MPPLVEVPSWPLWYCRTPEGRKAAAAATLKAQQTREDLARSIEQAETVLAAELPKLTAAVDRAQKAFDVARDALAAADAQLRDATARRREASRLRDVSVFHAEAELSATAPADVGALVARIDAYLDQVRLGCKGYLTAAELEPFRSLRARAEQLRLSASPALLDEVVALATEFDAMARA